MVAAFILKAETVGWVCACTENGGLAAELPTAVPASGGLLKTVSFFIYLEESLTN